MKKRVLSVFLVVIMIVPLFAFNAGAAGLTLGQLQEKFPAGRYWNHIGSSGNRPDETTSSPCTHHADGCSKDHGFGGGCGCNSFLGLSIQCMGFAEKCGYDATGYNPRNDANGWYTYFNSTALDKLKPGDIVRYTNNGHSIFVTAVDGDTVTYGDCNSDGQCIIRWNRTITKAKLKATFKYLRSAPAALDGSQLPSPAAPENVRGDQKLYASSESPFFSWDASPDAIEYRITIWQDGREVYTRSVGVSTSCTVPPMSAGEYTLIVSADNGEGDCCNGQGYPFTVYDSKPDNPTISLDKGDNALYKTTEDVTINYSATNATGYMLWIDKDGKRVSTPDTGEESTYAASFEQTGHYSVYVLCYNAIGGVDSERVNFTVYDPNAWVNPFADVAEGDWFHDAVQYVNQNSIVSGTAATAFSPKTPLSRAMIVTILYRLEGEPNVKSLSYPFSDSCPNWSADAIKWAYQNNIVTGKGNGCFVPNESITRQDLAVILSRYAAFAGVKLPSVRSYTEFADKGRISGYAADAVQALYRAGVINGKGDNAFDPLGRATRAEAVTMLYRFQLVTGAA